MTTICLVSFFNFVTFSKFEWNGSARLRYAMIISLKWQTHVITSNTGGFLRIQRHDRKKLKRKAAKDSWNKLG